MDALGYAHYRNNAHDASIILHGARNLVESSFGLGICLKWREPLDVGKMLGRMVLLTKNECKGSVIDAKDDMDLTDTVC